MHKTLLSFLFAVLILSAAAQSQMTITGRAVNAVDQKPVGYATVTLYDNNGRIVTAVAALPDGRFSPLSNPTSAQSISRGPSLSTGRQLKQLNPCPTEIRAREPLSGSAISTICVLISIVGLLSVVYRPLNTVECSIAIDYGPWIMDQMGRLAQLARASCLHRECRGFESLIAQINITLLIALLLSGPTAAHESASQASRADANITTDRKSVVDPAVLLIRDASVRAELKLSDEQRLALDNLLHKHNHLLLAIRDSSPSGVAAVSEFQELRLGFTKNLSEKQRARLTNLVLQAQGYKSLLRKDVSARLHLTDQQCRELEITTDEIFTRLQKLRKENAGHPPENLQKSVVALQREQQQRVFGILNKQQVAQYIEALGAPFDLSKVKASPADAPELEGIEAWINSEPITMQSLRGRVVIVNFLAFDCINCIHNYPWYKDWHKRLAGKGVTIIGIHTPETKREHDNNLLAASLKKHELLFPVAIDKDRKMWKAWSNGIWPTVYIVDKHGHLRYWWYGELDWQGAGNQKVVEKQIELLLAEE